LQVISLDDGREKKDSRYFEKADSIILKITVP